MEKEQGMGKEFMERLYRENYQRIYRYCCGKLDGSRAEAEDCAMEVFVRGYEKVRELMRHPCPEKWLYLTARHVVQEQYRRQIRVVPREAPEDWGRVTVGNWPASGGEQDSQWLLPETPAITAEELCRRLKPKEQELFRLAFLEERPLGEVAQILGIRYTNVTTRVHRLRRKLQKILQKEYSVEGAAYTDKGGKQKGGE